MTSFWVFVRVLVLLITLGGSFGDDIRTHESFNSENSEEYFSPFQYDSDAYYEDYESITSTSDNPSTPVPSVPAYNYNFHVDSVTEEHRTVRIFFNSFDNPYAYHAALKLRLLEENQTLIEDEVVRGKHLIRNISHNEHTFVFYRKTLADSVEESVTSVKVPAQKKLLTLPGFVARISADGEYVYQWKLPRSDETIVNVSMIWCDTIHDGLRTCVVDLLDQTQLDVDQTEFRLNMSGRYKAMALRVDTETSSTGIVRPACETDESKVGMLNNSPIMSANASHISIEWAMQCPEEGVVYGVLGYLVNYCPVGQNECVYGDEYPKVIETKENTFKYVIDGLTQATQYKIIGNVFLQNGDVSNDREQLMYSTMEASSHQHPYRNSQDPGYKHDVIDSNPTTNGPEICVPPTSNCNTDSDVVDDAENHDGDEDDNFQTIITTTNGNSNTVTSVPPSSHYNSGENVSGIDFRADADSESAESESADVDPLLSQLSEYKDVSPLMTATPKYEVINPLMTTTLNPATIVPSGVAFNYNFTVVNFISEKSSCSYRYVRIFNCNFEDPGNMTEYFFRITPSVLGASVDCGENTIICYEKPYAGSIERNFTITKVPAQSELLTLPGFVASISASGEYVYRWVLPRSNKTVVKVSMLECVGTYKGEHSCYGQINEHAELDVNQTEFRLNMREDYKGMSLRVDTETSSTGIVRPACENIESEVGILNGSPIISANASHISIEWAMQCPDEGVVYGVAAFNVYYCPVRDDKCVEPETKQTWKIQESTVLETVIGDLAPDTQYKIAGTVTLANGKESARRERLYTTMEDAVVSIIY